MLVVDTSSSMLKNPDGSPWEAAEDAKAVANGLIEYLRPKDQVGLVKFNGGGIPVSTLTKDFLSVKTEVASLRSEANASHVYGGLELAQAELTSARHNGLAKPIIILLTDGQYPYEGEIPDRIKRAGTKIIGVGIGWDGRPVPGWSGNPGEVLRQICSESYFRSYGDPLTPTVTEIIRRITQEQCLLNKPPVVSAGTDQRIYLPENASFLIHFIPLCSVHTGN